ncbi:MAG: glycosyltransferase family 2 protein [Alphaproteobacteria bacterium]|nr:glycosyltransferase family 2 protein [Alphaproteobacteria bacterium]MBP7759488.1 glycosyltransferase family 2 protein [Alphaproteobacteria bacterium]MBP7762828.1 glycosyltransferase family 2 protein [Alphaproteobacteria bacterium]MBP7904320.1 glycosyltransferase family 2 protein [Alphaproteobacteria bacterium]
MTTKPKKKTNKELISIIIPCYNEQEVIRLCHERVTSALAPLPYDLEIIYINDGSRDNTYEILKEINASDKRARVLNLSRNFGKEAAMTAGIDAARGDALIILDADLQDPPELIPELIRIWKEEGADVVYGQRVEREGETWFKKATASGFYKLMNNISAMELPRNTGDFRIMNRRAVEALKQLREHHRFMKGLFAWIGYRQVALQYNRHPRAAGTTKWNYWKLSNFAMEGITSFSIVPLRIATFAGFLISLMAFGYGSFILLKTLMFGRDLPGYTSLMVMITFLSGIQLLTIGILGEYIGRIFGETKNRPLYFIEEEL